MYLYDRLSQLIRTANFSYANALHRATPYLTGIGLGVMLKNTGKNIQLPKVNQYILMF